MNTAKLIKFNRNSSRAVAPSAIAARVALAKYRVALELTRLAIEKEIAPKLASVREVERLASTRGHYVAENQTPIWGRLREDGEATNHGQVQTTCGVRGDFTQFATFGKSDSDSDLSASNSRMVETSNADMVADSEK